MILARKSVTWDERLKPNKDFIYEQILAGRTNKEIFTALGVSHTEWYNLQKNHEEFKELISKAREEYVETMITTGTQILLSRPPEEKMLEELERKFFDPETSANEKINIYKTLYPEADWYRGIRIRETEIKKRNSEKTTLNIETKTIIGEDMIDMLKNAVDPNEFNESK